MTTTEKDVKVIEPNIPSAVLHLRNVPLEAVDTELLILARTFGKVKNLFRLPGKTQGFLELESIQTATQMLKHYQTSPATVGQNMIYLQYSQHQSLQLQPSTDIVTCDKGEAEGTILEIKVLDMVYPVTLETMCQILYKYGHILKIVSLTRGGVWHCYVQLADKTEANKAMEALNGQYMYHECNQLDISISANKALLVKYNNTKSWDFTNPSLPIGADFGFQHHPVHGYDNIWLGAGMRVGPSQPCVLQVRNLNTELVTPDILFTLFGVYSDVQRVKILYKQPESALIQIKENMQAYLAMIHLNGVPLFGKDLHIVQSRHPEVRLSSHHSHHHHHHSNTHPRTAKPTSKSVEGVPGMPGLPGIYSQSKLIDNRFGGLYGAGLGGVNGAQGAHSHTDPHLYAPVQAHLTAAQCSMVPHTSTPTHAQVHVSKQKPFFNAYGRNHLTAIGTPHTPCSPDGALHESLTAGASWDATGQFIPQTTHSHNKHHHHHHDNKHSRNQSHPQHQQAHLYATTLDNVTDGKAKTVENVGSDTGGTPNLSSLSVGASAGLGWVESTGTFAPTTKYGRGRGARGRDERLHQSKQRTQQIRGNHGNQNIAPGHKQKATPISANDQSHVAPPGKHPPTFESRVKKQGCVTAADIVAGRVGTKTERPHQNDRTNTSGSGAQATLSGSGAHQPHSAHSPPREKPTDTTGPRYGDTTAPAEEMVGGAVGTNEGVDEGGDSTKLTSVKLSSDDDGGVAMVTEDSTRASVTDADECISKEPLATGDDLSHTHESRERTDPNKTSKILHQQLESSPDHQDHEPSQALHTDDTTGHELPVAGSRAHGDTTETSEQLVHRPMGCTERCVPVQEQASGPKTEGVTALPRQHEVADSSITAETVHVKDVTAHYVMVADAGGLEAGEAMLAGAKTAGAEHGVFSNSEPPDANIDLLGVARPATTPHTATETNTDSTPPRSSEQTSSLLERETPDKDAKQNTNIQILGTTADAQAEVQDENVHTERVDCTLSATAIHCADAAVLSPTTEDTVEDTGTLVTTEGECVPEVDLPVAQSIAKSAHMAGAEESIGCKRSVETEHGTEGVDDTKDKDEFTNMECITPAVTVGNTAEKAGTDTTTTTDSTTPSDTTISLVDGPDTHPNPHKPTHAHTKTDTTTATKTHAHTKTETTTTTNTNTHTSKRKKRTAKARSQNAHSNENALCKDYSKSPLHRFRIIGSKNYGNIAPPSSTLHLSNIPADTPDTELIELCSRFGTVIGLRFFPTPRDTERIRLMALVAYASKGQAVDALVRLHNHQIHENMHLRVSFSKTAY